MKKIALFVAVLMLATATLSFGASAETPADDGVVVDFNPEAITEDLSGINGLADQTPVQITGSVGITSLAAHSVGGVDGVKVSLEEENGEKFVRLTNTEFSGTYNQIFINMDASVFSPDTEYYFSLTIRTNKGFACNDAKGRALVARIHTPSFKDNTIVTSDDLIDKDFSEWTTLTFQYDIDIAHEQFRLINWANHGDYYDIKDFKIYTASAEPVTEPTTEPATEPTAEPTTEPATEPVEGGEVTPPTGDYTFVLLAACILAAAAVVVLATKKVRN